VGEDCGIKSRSATVLEDSLRSYARIDYSARGVLFLSSTSSLFTLRGRNWKKIERTRRETPFLARDNEKAHRFGACERSGRECGLTVYGSFLLFTVLIIVYVTDN
jgi:hypothetical protein